MSAWYGRTCQPPPARPSYTTPSPPHPPPITPKHLYTNTPNQTSHDHHHTTSLIQTYRLYVPTKSPSSRKSIIFGLSAHTILFRKLTRSSARYSLYPSLIPHTLAHALPTSAQPKKSEHRCIGIVSTFLRLPQTPPFLPITLPTADFSFSLPRPMSVVNPPSRLPNPRRAPIASS